MIPYWKRQPAQRFAGAPKTLARARALACAWEPEPQLMLELDPCSGQQFPFGLGAKRDVDSPCPLLSEGLARPSTQRTPEAHSFWKSLAQRLKEHILIHERESARLASSCTLQAMRDALWKLLKVHECQLQQRRERRCLSPPVRDTKSTWREIFAPSQYPFLKRRQG